MRERVFLMLLASFSTPKTSGTLVGVTEYGKMVNYRSLKNCVLLFSLTTLQKRACDPAQSDPAQSDPKAGRTFATLSMKDNLWLQGHN